MGMMLEVYCDMCVPPRRPPLQFDIDEPKELEPQALKERIKAEGWIVQFNGDHRNTYCTKKCAE